MARSTLGTLLLGVFGCAVGVHSADPRADSGGGAVVVVGNNTIDEQRLYLHSGATELFLGTVLPLSTRLVLVPRRWISSGTEYRLVLRKRISEPGFVSQPFILLPRSYVTWTVRDEHSTAVFVRPTSWTTIRRAERGHSPIADARCHNDACVEGSRPEAEEPRGVPERSR